MSKERRRFGTLENKDRLTERLRAVRVLAERGSPGEREAAQTILSSLMKKYAITEADIQEERTEIAWFRYKEELEEKLLNQIIYMVMGDCGTYSRKGRDSNRKHKVSGVECTAAQRLEIEIAFDFYKRAMKEEQNTFYRAFVQKNELFPPPELVRNKPGESDLSNEEVMKMFSMMNGMERRTLRKMIAGGSEE
jgi:hypothetical protein